MKKILVILALMLSFIIPVNTPLSGMSFAADTSSAAGSSLQGEVPFNELRPVVNISSYKDKTRVSWSAVKNAKYYMIYRSTSVKGKYKKIKKTTSLSYNDGTGESGKVYYYKVRAFHVSGQRSKYSEPVKHKTIYRIYIACGHGVSNNGVWDPGCTYKGMQEAKLMLPITEDFVRYMRNSGVYVYTDADNGNNLNLIKCVKAANKKKISAYISIHCDWRYSPSGTMPLYKTKKTSSLHLL